MSKSLPRKALISISSFNGAIYTDGRKTGLFYTEALHPFEVLTEAGFEVDLASETGTFGMDAVSVTEPFLSGSDYAVLDNPKHPFNLKLNSQLKKAGDLKKEVRLVLCLGRPFGALRLPDCDGASGNCLTYLGSWRHCRDRVPWSGAPAGRHRLSNRQDNHRRQAGYWLHD